MEKSDEDYSTGRGYRWKAVALCVSERVRLRQEIIALKQTIKGGLRLIGKCLGGLAVLIKSCLLHDSGRSVQTRGYNPKNKSEFGSIVY